MSFTHLGLSDKVLAAAKAAGYTIPPPIQEQAIPHVLARRDVLGIAQTGTGKTAAFVLPMLTMLEQGRARARMPRTLILEPTRELAAQVEDSFEKYGKNHKLNVALIIGGVSFDNQDAKLTRGVDVLIATPGRLLDHFERGRLLMSGVELLVRHGFNAAALHGDLDQAARTAALESFRNGEVTLLIASDVAARGLDIPDVSHIFNFDVPHHADDYVHRIGRTGRAGKSGTAITVVAPADHKNVAAIERLIGKTIPWMGEQPAGIADEGPAPRPHRKHAERRNGRGPK